MTEERNRMFTTKMFGGPESQIRTNDGFKVDLNTERIRRVLTTNSDLPILVLVSGTSESGKSHLGQKFVIDKVGHRLKIYKTISDLMQSQDLPRVQGVKDFDSVAFASNIEGNPELRTRTVDKLTSEYLRVMHETGVSIGVVETLKNPWLVKELENRDDIRVMSIYIDAPFQSRVNRQARKHNRSIEEVSNEVKEKDIHKAGTGTEEIRDIADIVIWNAGSIETFNNFVDIFEKSLIEHSKKSSNNTIDYS